MREEKGMITYCDKNVFLLSGKCYSYGMYVNALGMLQHLYYGKRIDESDAEFLAEQYGDPEAPSGNDINYTMATNGMPSEVGSFGRGDFRAATVIIKRNDGSAMSCFRYKRCSVRKGAIPLHGMPCVRHADETLTITLKDDFSDTELDLNYTVSEDSDVLVRSTVIRNVGPESVKISRAYSFCTELPDVGEKYYALRLAGDWARERRPISTPIEEGTLRIESTRGYSSHQMNPFMAIMREGCSENVGECFGYSLIYSGSFALTAEKSCRNTIRVQGGINDYTFDWQLKSGESFETPQVAMCCSIEGLGGLSRAYADFFREYIIHPDRVYQHRPVVVNNWEATYFGFTNEKLFAIIDEGAKLGVDTFVLDDGWFGKRKNEQTGLGDWFVNEKKMEGGLNSVIHRCKEKGLRFGLWIEPEMVSEDSALYRAHPDWAVKKEGVEPCRSRYQLVLDFTRKEVVDYVFFVVSKLLQEYDISYIKWDKNRDLTENFTANLPPDRQGEFLHRYMLGVYDLAERITTAFPNVFIEGCAGGGGRFDGGMLYYFSQSWTSDDTDAAEHAKIQWGTSIAYPVSAMSCHVSICPNHQVGRITPFETRGAIASLGATGYELDLSKLSETEKSQVKSQIANYKRIESLVLRGDLYRLSSPFESNYFVEMLVSKDRANAYVVGECLRKEPVEHPVFVKLNGLDESAVYLIEELGSSASGHVLGSKGLALPYVQEYGSWTWHLHRIGAVCAQDWEE